MDDNWEGAHSEKRMQKTPHGKEVAQHDDCSNTQGFSSPESVAQSSSRAPFTSLSQADADLALARALQEQERAYMLLSITNDSSGYDSSGSGNCDYEGYNNDVDEDTYLHYTDFEVDNDGSDLLAEQHSLERGVILGNQHEIDDFPFDSDEAFAQALQEVEEYEAMAQMMSFAVGGDDNDESNSLQDVDLDNMLYEELIALGEAVGAHNRGLAPDLIAALPYTEYMHEQGENISDSYPCIICHLDYEDGDFLSTLPCKHQYHSSCIKNWLQIKKICPVCCMEVIP
eukprot:c18725_g1_i1 orf=391-1245(+)